MIWFISIEGSDPAGLQSTVDDQKPLRSAALLRASGARPFGQSRRFPAAEGGESVGEGPRGHTDGPQTLAQRAEGSNGPAGPRYSSALETTSQWSTKHRSQGFGPDYCGNFYSIQFNSIQFNSIHPILLYQLTGVQQLLTSIGLIAVVLSIANIDLHNLFTLILFNFFF